MPHAGSIPKQVPQKNSAHLLAKHNNKCRAPRPNWDAAHLVRSKEKKMEVDWPRKQNAIDIYSKNSHALDPRRKQEGTTKRDVEKVRGARDEGSRAELGPGRKAGSGQTTMAFLGVGLMCEHARRGLSKYRACPGIEHNKGQRTTPSGDITREHYDLSKKLSIQGTGHIARGLASSIIKRNMHISNRWRHILNARNYRKKYI